VNSWKKVSSKVNYQTQFAFLWENLLDNVLVANEMIDEIRHKKKNTSITLEKA